MDDFWLMVQQENSDTIVMLCNCVEMHKEKSAKYWPEEVGDTLLLGENREGVDLEVKGFICQPWHISTPTNIRAYLSGGNLVDDAMLYNLR